MSFGEISFASELWVDGQSSPTPAMSYIVLDSLQGSCVCFAVELAPLAV